MRKIHKSNVIIRAALILLCLVLFTAHLSSGMLAKYTISSGGSNIARVANTKITVTPAAQAPVIGTTGSASYAFTVTNTAEVSYNYSIIAYFDSSMTLSADQLATAFSNVKLSYDGHEFAGVFDADDKSYTFANVGTFSPSNVADMTLTFKAGDLAAVSSTVTVESGVMEDIVINIAVKTVQID